MKSCFLILIVVLAIDAAAQSGISWDTPTTIAASSFGNLHPRITLDGRGNPCVIWGRMNDQSVFFSKWNGMSFTAPKKLNGSITIATASWMGPDIASHGDTIYVVMKQTPESESASHIYIVRSEDGGATFSAPARLDNIADSISRFPTVTCDAQGNPVVAFMKFSPGFLESRWVVARSRDLGRSFTADSKASGWGGAKGICDCCPGAVVVNDDTCAVLYRNNDNDIRDIWMGVSQNGGTSFITGGNIDSNRWDLPSCPATGPDGVVMNGTLYSVFCSSSSTDNGNYRTFLSTTSFQNATWNNTRHLAGSVPGLSQQNYPRISSNGTALGIVWNTVNSTAQLPILFTNNIGKGLPATYDLVDVNDITNADIALADSRVFVCWEDGNAGTVGFRSGRYTPAVSDVMDSPNHEQLTIHPNPASDRITIGVSASEYSTVAILNALGEVLLELPSYNSSVELNNLPNGMYAVRDRLNGRIRLTFFAIAR